MITTSFKYKKFNFPCGERHVIIEDIDELPQANIVFQYEGDAEIMELLLVADAIKRLGGYIQTLQLTYIPYSRQDRVNIQGESLSLKVFCDLINGIGAREVIVEDPHSDVAVALINNCTVIPQHEIFEKYLHGKEPFYLLSPDGGALKKIYKLAAVCKPIAVLECSKIRNTSTGEITGVHVPPIHSSHPIYIVDDICDGGRTFVEIAKAIPAASKDRGNKIILMVTHGFFTKGLGVFDGLIDEIYTRKGKVK